MKYEIICSENFIKCFKLTQYLVSPWWDWLSQIRGGQSAQLYYLSKSADTPCYILKVLQSDVYLSKSTEVLLFNSTW